MQQDPVKEHQWLQKFVGEWTYEGRCTMGPDQPEMTFSGKEKVRAIGDLWVHGESTGAMPGGGTATMLLTVGYDIAKGRFVGTWAGSMMSNLFVYDGWIEQDGKTLVLETKGACPMMPGEMRTFRDITEFKSDDHRAFRAEMKNDDGSWTRLMSMDMHRVK